MLSPGKKSIKFILLGYHNKNLAWHMALMASELEHWTFLVIGRIVE